MNALTDNYQVLLEGFWATFRLAVTSAVLSMLLGTFLVSLRVAPTAVLRAVGTFYVNTMRNTPLTLVLVFCFLGVSNTLDLKFSEASSINGFWWATTGLSAYTAAFVCESLRSGINTVPMGQAEAARAIGLSFNQSLRMVILPQAFRSVIAPLGSVIIAMTKNTTVVMVAGYAETAARMKDILDDGYNPLWLFLGVAVGFMVLTLPTGFASGWSARRWAVHR